MFTYIKYDIDGFYVELPEKLTEDLYDNLGSSWDDFIDYKWILLSDNQVEFHQMHPEASIREVYDMKLNEEIVRSLKDAKNEMLTKITNYDQSSDVNGFTINNAIEAWFTPSERSNYKSSIDAAKLLGLDSLSFYVGDVMLDIAPSIAEGLLAQIQLYADQCFIVTKQHKAAVEALQTIEEVDNYDYTAGYPGKMNFDIA